MSTLELMDEPQSRAVLAANINKLMQKHPALSTNVKLAAEAGLGLGTVARIRNASTAATLDTIDVLARVFGLEPWQMLVKDLDPKRLEVYARLKELISSEKGGTL